MKEMNAAFKAARAKNPSPHGMSITCEIERRRCWKRPRGNGELDKPITRNGFTVRP